MLRKPKCVYAKDTFTTEKDHDKSILRVSGFNIAINRLLYNRTVGMHVHVPKLNSLNYTKSIWVTAHINMLHKWKERVETVNLITFSDDGLVNSEEKLYVLIDTAR